MEDRSQPPARARELRRQELLVEDLVALDLDLSELEARPSTTGIPIPRLRLPLLFSRTLRIGSSRRAFL